MGQDLVMLLVASWPVAFMFGIGLCWRARQIRIKQHILNDSLRALHIISSTRGKR